MIYLLMLFAAQASAPLDDPVAAMAPASEAALRAAVKACVGSTADPASEQARLSGWKDTVPAGAAKSKSDGRMVTRDNVVIMVKPGLTGGCVVMANAAADFDATRFRTDLGGDLGKTIATDPKNPVTELGGGEVLITMLPPSAGANRVMLVIGNAKADHEQSKDPKR